MIRVFLLVWLLRRLLILGALAGGWLDAQAPSQLRWIAVLGGGGGRRLARARELQARHEGAVIVVAGSPFEIDAARKVFRDTPREAVRYLEVWPASTQAGVAALRGLPSSSGVLVTHRRHAPRVRLSWLLAGLGSIPPIDGLRGEFAPRLSDEIVKALGYLLIY